MNERIAVGAAYMEQGVEEAVAEVLRSGWPGPGPRADQFEQAFGQYCNGAFPVAVNSCTSALHLALHLLGLEPGTEVVTTPITFVATNKVMLYEGLVPVFADIDPATGHITEESIRDRITANTGAIMLMHYAGYPCDLDAIYALAEARGLPVIEDCAHAAGARYRGRMVGSHQGLQAFSFQSTKNLSAVDGGLLFVRNEEEMLRARRLRWMGIDSSTYERTGSAGQHNAYGVIETGFRYAMSDLNAAIALVNLKGLDRANARRAEIAALYTDALADTGSLRLLSREPDRHSSHHLFPVLCERRDEVAAALLDSGIVTGRHYQRNDTYPVFATAEVPNADYFSTHVLTLPLHPYLDDRQVEYVIDAVRACA